MPYCPKCGVEVESNHCPLCNHQIKQNIHTIPFSHVVEIEKKKIYFSNRDKKRIFHASTIFFAILVTSICVTVDLLLDSEISWSIYPIIAVWSLALITSASIYVNGILKGIVILLLNLLMLFLLDIQIPVKNFFLMISLPISFMTSVISFTIYITIKKSKRRGMNIPGYILIGLTIVNILIDLLVQNFIHGIPKLTWSLITTVTLVPIALFLLYIHYVLSKKIDLSKIFHT